jgi:hypothetical protein
MSGCGKSYAARQGLTHHLHGRQSAYIRAAHIPSALARRSNTRLSDEQPANECGAQSNVSGVGGVPEGGGVRSTAYAVREAGASPADTAALVLSAVCCGLFLWGRGRGPWCRGSRSSKSNPITCSRAASAGVLLERAHLLVAYCN